MAIFPYPNLPFLALLEFLAFFFSKEFLAFFSVFPFFPRDFRGRLRIKNPCFLGGFPCRFPKKQGREDQGMCRGRNHMSQGVENRGSLVSVPVALKDEPVPVRDLISQNPRFLDVLDRCPTQTTHTSSINHRVLQ